MLLALVAQTAPITAYQIAKFHHESPLSSFNTSKGKIYPIIRKLHEAGLLKSRAVRGDARGTELWEITKNGQEAVRAWILEIKPGDLLSEDSMRTRVQLFGLLTRGQRIEWISELKLQLLKKLEDVEQYDRESSLPYYDLVKASALGSIRNRIDWLDHLLNRVVREKA